MFMAYDLANLGPCIRNLIPFMGPMCRLNFLFQILDIDGDRIVTEKITVVELKCTFYFIICTIDECSFTSY